MIKYVTIDSLSKTQLNQIIFLFKKSFPGNISKLEKNLLFTLKNSKKQKWIIAYFQNKLCGALLLKFKKMNYQGIKLNVCGMSYMAVDKKIQKLNVAKKLINMMFEISKKYDLILGFARKKMDGYYLPYGFVGITDFGTLNINTLCIKNYDSYLSVKIQNIKQNDLSEIQKFYQKNNSFITGNLIREKYDFKNFMLNNTTTQIKIFKKKNLYLGYLVLRNNLVIEIRVDPRYYIECSYSLKKYFLSKSIQNIEFNTNLNDPFLRYLSRFSHQLSTRYFFDGGHIIRIVNLEKILNKLKPLLEKKLTYLRINKLSINYEGLSLMFSNKKINYKFLKNIDTNLITKLIFGIIPVSDPKLEILFGNVHIQFPTIDHF